ncbi:hypothetical protein EC957_005339 [Mortierella hygrophila]|uniref:GPI anchored protein n=1 Tax=Mortierella hygrophila TaxID=979708 RepID=A0A9P6JZA3_9FUNG|nr:hypothetical protein EC957_005339 [Mortierella hygrophila]
MRSFTKVASFVAALVAALTVLAPSSVQAQEGVTFYDKRTLADNPFKASGYQPLMMLAEGPYPSADTSLEKRAIGTCDPGYNVCTAAGGYCCQTGSLCSPTSRLCCPTRAPYICGGTECCLYQSCNAAGGCGCPLTQTTCGDSCCSNGCDKTGQFCACKADTPVDCGGMYCCSIGMSCSAGSRCAATTTTSGFGNFPTNIGGSRSSADSVKQASAPFAAVMAAAAIVFGA